LWLSGKTLIVVAISAFSMGIDKPNVRAASFFTAVLKCCLPISSFLTAILLRYKSPNHFSRILREGATVEALRVSDELAGVSEWTLHCLTP
jgi:hypothetical protein